MGDVTTQHLALFALFAALAFGLVAVIVSKTRKPAPTVRDELNELRAEGYIVMHDVSVKGSESLDHVVIGKDAVYLVETTYGSTELELVKSRAELLRDALGSQVTPIVCAGSGAETFEHEHVVVAGRSAVVAMIRARPGGHAVDLERVAQFAATLG